MAKRWLFKSAAIVWGLAPLVFLLTFAAMMYVKAPPDPRIVFVAWAGLAILWALAFLVLFSFMLRAHQQGRDAHFPMALLSTVSFGLPAIALGALPAVGPANRVTSPRKVDQVSLGALAADHPSRPIKYIVGTDYSKSFSPRQDANVADIVSRLFNENGPVGISLEPADQFQMMGFAQGPPLLLIPGHDGETFELNYENQHLLMAKLAGHAPFQARWSVVPDKDFNVNKTDAIGFIRGVCSKLQAHRDFAAVRLLLFSDFAQSPPLGPYSHSQLAALHDLVQDLPEFSVVGFKSRHGALAADEDDVLPALREAMGADHFQEVDLDEYLHANDAAERMMTPYGLFSNSDVERRCELAAAGDDSAVGPKLRLDLPGTREFDELYFALSNGKGPARLRVKVPGCDGATSHARVLDTDVKGGGFCKLVRMSSNSGPVEIEVEGDLGGTHEAMGDLMVAIPRHGAIRRIPIRLSRFENSDELLVLLAVLLIFNLVPLRVSLMMIGRRAIPMPADGRVPMTVQRAGVNKI